MTRKKPTPIGWFYPFGILILILFFIGITIYQSCYTDAVYRVIHSPQAISRIEMRIIAAPDTIILRDPVIKDKGELQKFNTALQGGRRISFGSPRMHSIFIDMNIYKNKMVNISILKIIDSGWVIGVGDDWYRNDSLVNLLIPYLSLRCKSANQ